MKKHIFKNAIAVLLALLMLVSVLSGCGEDKVEPTQPEEKATSLLLLGFESYEEVTGTKLAMGNMLGRMEINTDSKYLTQGAGSLKIAVQGDYNDQKSRPWLKLDFLNTTCATCDFSEFKNISFDVYNASSEKLEIQAGINIGKTDGNYIASIKQSYILEPESWTTCTYDFMQMAGFSIYDFSNVRHMTIDFMDHKQSREDTPSVVYMDNLMGHYFGEGEQPEQVSYSLYNGLDFETTGQELLFTGQGKDNDAVIGRASYAKAGIEAPENGGEYAIKLSHDSFLWPTFRINFGEVLPAGTVISFDAYARIDGESLYNQSIFEFSDGGEATVQFPCDGWVKLDFALKKDSSYVDLFWNFDRAGITSDSAIGEVFIDNLTATAPVPPIEPEGNLWEGLDFEIPGNAAMFEGQKIEGDERRDATIERLPYKELEIPALENGGNYALRLSHDNNYWPTFRINFGEVLPKGTIITFQAYARITSGTNSYNQSIFEYSAGGEATEQFKCDAWTELTMKLPESADHIDLFWNYDRAGITSASASAEVYIDNMIATPGKTPIKPEGSFLEGLDFEIKGNVGYFVGQNDDKNDAVIDWVSYKDTKIPALENGGSHLMKLSHDSFFWPAFRMNFGTTLPAGTKITFMAYGTVNGKTQYNQSIFEFTGGGEATKQFKCNEWTELTITLPKAASYIDLFWNYDRAGILSGTAGAVYIDNMIAVTPGVPVGNLLDGIDFEVKGNEHLFAGVGGENAWRDATFKRVKYSDLSIDAPANGGEYALKLTCAASQWPVFRLNFGTTLKAGTRVNFVAYTRDLADTEKVSVSIFEYVSGGEATEQYYFNGWSKLSILLTSDCDHIDLMCNMDRWNEPGPANLEVYLDNFKAIEPAPVIEPTGDIMEGFDFEEKGNIGNFAGIGANQDATIEWAAYEQLGVSGPENSGDYALKLSHSSHYYPTFQLNFGKTLKAGTTITFNVYGSFDGWKSGNDMNIEFTGDSGSGQVVYMIPETWFTATITLTEDRDHLQFFWNIERGNGITGDVASYILIDNVKATLPPVEPSGDILAGIGFEEEGNDLRFTGIGAAQDAEAERVTYADLGVAGPENSGDYALKLSHSSHYYPTFQLNFGKTLKAGTTITFNVYGSFDGWQSGNDMNIEFTGDSGSGQVVYMIPETWFTATITLANDCDHLQFFWNIERGNGITGDVASYILIDNVKAVEPIVPTGDFTEGVDFETNGNELLFGAVGGSNAWRDATLEKVAYADAGIAAPVNGGSYALKITCASSQWPVFRINFGKTLKAGTVISFNAYTNDTSGIRNTVSIFEYVSGGEATSQYYHGSWNTLTMTLASDCSYIDLMCNLDRWNEPGPANMEVYVDSFLAVEPIAPTGDFTEGVDFETNGNELLFGAVGGANAWRDATLEKVAYADAGISAPANGGSYALKLTCASSQWPVFRINFGKTLSAGTVITFDAYTNDTSGIRNTVSVFEYVSGGDATQQYYHGSWNTLTMTLASDCSYIDLVCTLDRWNEPGPANFAVYLDNFKATQPGAGEEPVQSSIGFEAAGEEQMFAPLGGQYSGRDAAIERVTYADLGVAAPADGGSYALKLSHADNYWPTFRINFGKKLKAGTTVTFMAYGKITSGTNKYNQSIFEYVSGGEATAQFKCDQWTELTITLSADAEYIDLFWNYDRAQITSSSASGEVYIDNIVVVEP